MQKGEGVKAIADALGMQILFDLREDMHKGRTHTKAVLPVICMFYVQINCIFDYKCLYFFEVKEVVR